MQQYWNEDNEEQHAIKKIKKLKLSFFSHVSRFDHRACFNYQKTNKKKEMEHIQLQNELYF